MRGLCFFVLFCCFVNFLSHNFHRKNKLALKDLWPCICWRNISSISCAKKIWFCFRKPTPIPFSPPPKKVKYCFIFVRKTNGTLFTIMYPLFCSPIIILRVCHSDWCSFRLYYSEDTNLFFVTMQKCIRSLLNFNTMILPN